MMRNLIPSSRSWNLLMINGSSTGQTRKEIAWRRIGAQLYLLNAALLATHKIDPACCHEWDLFRPSAGIMFFLIINLALLWLVIFAFSQVVTGAPIARWLSCRLAIAAIFAFTIHTVFLAIGHDQFRTPMSIALLGVILVVSLTQTAVTALCERKLVNSDWI